MENQSLGHYQLGELLGKGGMGEVYLATDTRLDRKVAIKVLPPHLAQDGERRQRLEREARSISGLNHPNICTLYDVGHVDGTDFLVMELLEGDTLTARISNGPMPADEFLETAIQITEGLNAAHRAGLVHRDLKPGNIMLTTSGAKLLDFGLARTARDETVSSLTMAPTMTSPLTTEGTLVGTFQYLAPELLEGSQADTRSDLFALGLVLYEMTTGRAAFEGKTQAGLIGAILEREPAKISSIVPNVSPALENLIGACIAKDPDQRIQTAHDVLLQLRWIRDGGSAIGIPTSQLRSRKRTARLAWGLVLLLALSTAALSVAMLSREEPVLPRLLATVDPAQGSSLFTRYGNVAVSPDGSMLVYQAGDENNEAYLYLRHLGRDETKKLEGTKDSLYPFWSPDSKSIGFIDEERISRIDAVGGGRRTICELGDAAGASWGPDDIIVAGSYDPDVGLVKVSANGGSPVSFALPDTSLGEGSFRWPSFLPNGEQLLLTVHSPEKPPTVRVASLDGELSDDILYDCVNVEYADGHLLFVRESTLFAAPFDLRSFELGDAYVLVETMGTSEPWNRDGFSASQNGVLAAAGNSSSRAAALVIYERSGEISRVVELPTYATDLDISPDDRRAVVARPPSLDESSQDIWSYDLVRDVFTRVSFEGADDPVWSPDGRQVVYAQHGKLTRKSSSGVGEPELLVDRHRDAVTHDWSLDGKWLIYCVTDGVNEDLWAYDLQGDRGAFAVLKSEYREIQGQISPDGAWLAYVSDESGQRQVYVVSWPALDEKIQISRDGGVMPRWKRDLSELFYLSLSSALMSVSVSEDGNTLRIGQPEELFQTQMTLGSRTHEFDVDSTGENFYMIEEQRDDAEQRSILLLVNWASRD